MMSKDPEHRLSLQRGLIARSLPERRKHCVDDWWSVYGKDWERGNQEWLWGDNPGFELATQLRESDRGGSATDDTATSRKVAHRLRRLQSQQHVWDADVRCELRLMARCLQQSIEMDVDMESGRVSGLRSFSVVDWRRSRVVCKSMMEKEGPA